VENERLAELDGIRTIPGMPAHVFIKTGRSAVALYALKTAA
jgi:HlyD family secretion protein